MKTLNEKLAVLAKWMGYEYCGWNSNKHRAPVRVGYWGLASAVRHNPKIPGSMMFRPLTYHTSFDALWPVWVRFRDYNIQKIPMIEHGASMTVHENYCYDIGRKIIKSDTPAPAFELLVEGVEWLQCIK